MRQNSSYILAALGKLIIRINIHYAFQTTVNTPESTSLSPFFKSFISLLGGKFIHGLSPLTASSPSHRVEKARRGVFRLFP